MKSETGFTITPRLVVGCVVIVVGVLFALQNLQLIRAGEYIQYWPVVLIIIGAVKLVQPGAAPSRVAGVIWIVVGTVWVLVNVEAIGLRIRDFIPVFLILAGGYLVWVAISVRRPGSAANTDASATLNALAFMSGLNRRVVSQEFRGGEATAVMGGVEIDLRGASISESPAVIEVFAWWGGVELRVPEDWVVIGKVLPLLGGFEDKTKAPAGGADNKKQLIVKGMVVMGGVEVSN